VDPLTPEMDQKIQSAILAHQKRALTKGISQISPLERQILEESPIIKLIRGEKRPIQDELANRILSDISEEGSVAGSVVSSNGALMAEKRIQRLSKTIEDDAASSTTTTQIEEGGEPSTGTVTPIPPESHNGVRDFNIQFHLFLKTN
jgi:hypothetical protein